MLCGVCPTTRIAGAASFWLMPLLHHCAATSQALHHHCGKPCYEPSTLKACSRHPSVNTSMVAGRRSELNFKTSSTFSHNDVSHTRPTTHCTSVCTSMTPSKPWHADPAVSAPCQRHYARSPCWCACFASTKFLHGHPSTAARAVRGARHVSPWDHHRAASSVKSCNRFEIACGPAWLADHMLYEGMIGRITPTLNDSATCTWATHELSNGATADSLDIGAREKAEHAHPLCCHQLLVQSYAHLLAQTGQHACSQPVNGWCRLGHMGQSVTVRSPWRSPRVGRIAGCGLGSSLRRRHRITDA